jgi:sulfate transport system ATP-binding protein
MNIAIENLGRRYEGFAALERVSLEIADGEFLAVLGPSGSGKTTLLRILAGLDEPDEGSVRRGGEDLLALDARRRRVGMVFQHYALFPHMRVADNVAFGLRVRPRGQRPARREIAARVHELLRRMQLEDLGRRYPAQLSGGQRQRVALARALATEPSLLLLDEPFGALDAQVRVSLRGWLRELQRGLGLTTLFVTHDQEEALELADRVVVMNRGRIEQVGTPEQVYRRPATPFVHGFIGRASRLRARVEKGRLRFAGHVLDGELPRAWEGREVEAWLRPEQVAPAPGGWPARVLRLRHHAGSVRASLLLAGEAEPVEAEWNGQEALWHGIAEGDATAVALGELALFAPGEGGAFLRHVFVPRPAGAAPLPAGGAPWPHRKS